MVVCIHTDPKTIVIFGATGLQGGSVVRAMKDDKRFVVKAATRNAESESAKKLAAQGIGMDNSIAILAIWQLIE